MSNDNFIVETDRIDQQRWYECLDLFADASIYQTWAYGEERWGARALSHLVLKRDNDVVAMAQLRIVGYPALRCGVAYLRWGPLCQRKGREIDPAVVSGMARALYQEYVVRRGLCLRVLPIAFIGTPYSQLLDSAFQGYAREPFGPGQTYRTLVVDLQPTLEEIRARLEQKWRNQLNRSERNNLRVVEGTGVELFPVFTKLYDEMLARKKFSTATDLREFERLQLRLPERHRLWVLICEDKGIPVSGMVVTMMGNTGIYLFGATSDEGMKSKGAYLLQWTVVTRLKQSGYRYYNLGGINPETNPGVYHFKSGLSGEDLLYAHTCTACTSILSKAAVALGTLGKSRVRGLLSGRK